MIQTFDPKGFRKILQLPFATTENLEIERFPTETSTSSSDSNGSQTDPLHLANEAFTNWPVIRPCLRAQQFASAAVVVNGIH